MRLVRFSLQAVIGLFFVLALAALLQPPFNLGAILGITAFFLFLFLLTLLLREHTESRLTRGRSISPRVLGAFISFLGVGLCYFSIHVALGHPLSSGRRGQLLVVIVDTIGPWLPALVFAALGLELLYVGYRVFRSSQAIKA
ncbi:MAG: hypothetical protein N3C59_10405 [Azovibrio sp.]|nr:hypothetical protein [Azovibrio sp.]